MTADPSLTPPQEEIQEQPSKLPFPASAVGRIGYGMFVVIMPILAFMATAGIEPEWQSGNVADHVALWLSPEAAVIFIFLLLYSIPCYLFLLANPERYARSFVVRLGMIAGIPLALQYSVAVLLWAIYDGGLTLVLPSWLTFTLLPIVFPWMTRKWGARVTNIVFAVLAGVFYLGVALVSRQIMAPFLIVMVGLIAAAPLLSLWMYVRATIWLLKNYATKLASLQLMGGLAWIGAYVAAWRVSILKTMELYSALPTSPPDCYIATAAAQGHAHIVGSREVTLADGMRMRVNRQLQILKCAELVLQAAAPKVHAGARRIYDTLGKPLARRMRHPFVADLAYLSLKPAEILAATLLKAIVPQIETIVRSMYAH